MSRTESSMVALGTPAPAFELQDVLSGRACGRDDLAAGRKAMLVMFVCPHCPYVRHVEPEISRLSAQYGAEDGPVAIVAVQSNDLETYPQDGPDGMRAQAERCGWTFPYLLDATQEVARSFDAACTPDFFLYDGNLELVYRGQIDGSRPRRADGSATTSRSTAPTCAPPSTPCWRAGSRARNKKPRLAATSNGKAEGF